jgi:hypothetical protein
MDRPEEAIAIGRAKLAIAIAENWPESIGRAHRSLASAYREAARGSNAHEFHRALSLKHCEEAIRVSERLYIPALELEVLEEMAESSWAFRTTRLPWREDNAAVSARTERLIEKTGLEIYRVNLMVAKGRQALASGEIETARVACREARERAVAIGDFWALTAANSTLNRFSADLKMDPTAIHIAPRMRQFLPPAELLLKELNSSEVLHQLEEVRRLLA